MLKNVRKSKILLSLIAIILMIVLFGNVYSLATSDNGSNTVTITATTDNTSGTNNTTNTNNTNTNTNSNTNTNVAPISATANNTTNNTSTYNNTNSTSNSSSLPYTGTNSKTILLVVVFAISAVYAYKKVSDYNV